MSTFLQMFADPEAVRRYAEGFSWDATSEQQYQLFRRLVDAHAGRSPTRSTP